MPGQCYRCAATFSRFKKEHGCKNCGYAFCKDCLTKKTAIPKCDNEKHKVCDKCFNILTGKTVSSGQAAKYSPPEAYKKRVAALEDRDKNGHSGSTSSKETPSNPVSAKYRGLSAEDRAIAERLDKLKESRLQGQPPVPSQKEMEERLKKLQKDDKKVPPPSDNEMKERLARLRGQDPSKVNQPVVFKTDRRGEQTQIDDLLQEICDEVEVDSHGVDPAADVQRRLDHFKGTPDAASPPDDIQNNLNKTDDPSRLSYTKNLPLVGPAYQAAAGPEEGAADWQAMNRLIAEVAGELEMDAQRAVAGLRKDNELWERLQQLKDRKKKEDGAANQTEKQPRDANSVTDTPKAGVAIAEEESDEEKEEEAIKRILKQTLEADPAPPSTQAPGEPEDDELPWCCICNSDAVLRCFGCDGDLYCRRCFKEGHDKFDLEDHQTTSFKPQVA